MRYKRRPATPVTTRTSSISADRSSSSAAGTRAPITSTSAPRPIRPRSFTAYDWFPRASLVGPRCGAAIRIGTWTSSSSREVAGQGTSLPGVRLRTCCVCLRSITHRETSDLKWPVFQLGYMTVLTYVASLLVFQVTCPHLKRWALNGSRRQQRFLIFVRLAR